jgi:hypothetical protein
MHWFRSIFSDGSDDAISSKRLVTFVAFVLCAVAFLANLFLNLTIEEHIFEGMMYIAIAGLGFTASERFAGKPSIKEDV